MAALNHRMMDASAFPTPARPIGARATGAIAAGLARERCIGRSVEGRPLVLRSRGPASAPLRIAIIAGQHGDEHVATDAVERAMGQLADQEPSRQRCVEFVALANPDGAVRQRRMNAAGVDLNRDHLDLEAPETAALHAWLRRFRPHVIIDVHAYPSRRAWLSRHGFQHAGDVCIDWASCPAGDEAIQRRSAAIGQAALAATVDRGWRSSRYLVASGRGVLRPSSPTPMTLLNAALVRFNAAGLLVEAREPAAEEDGAAMERSTAATADAIVGLIHAAAAQDHDRPAPVPTAPRHVAVDGRWDRQGASPSLWVRDDCDQAVRCVPAPGRPRTAFRASCAVEVPTAYGLPAASWSTPIMECLDRLGFEPTASAPDNHRLEEPVLTSLVPSRRTDRTARRLRARWHPVTESHDVGWWWWDVRRQPEAARTLVCLMDPASRFGFARRGWIPLPSADEFTSQAVAALRLPMRRACPRSVN